MGRVLRLVYAQIGAWEGPGWVPGIALPGTHPGIPHPHYPGYTPHLHRTPGSDVRTASGDQIVPWGSNPSANSLNVSISQGSKGLPRYIT